MSTQSVDLLRDRLDQAEPEAQKIYELGDINFGQLQQWFGENAGHVFDLCLYSYRLGWQDGHQFALKENNDFLRLMTKKEINQWLK